MKKGIVIAVVGVVSALAVAYSVEAKLPGQWWDKPGVATKLGLKEDQVRSLDQAAFDHKTKAIELRAQLRQQQGEVKYLLNKDPIDKKAVVNAAVEAAGIRTEILANRIDEKLATRGYLSPLQQEKVDEMAHRRSRRPERQRPGKKSRGRKDERFRGRASGEWWENPEVAADVGLTEEQIGELRDSFYTADQKLIGLKAQKEIKELSLKRALEASDVDSKAIDGIVSDIGKIEKGSATNRTEIMVAERETLTAEQFGKLKTIRSEEAKERREFHRELALKRADREKEKPGRQYKPRSEKPGRERPGREGPGQEG